MKQLAPFALAAAAATAAPAETRHNGYEIPRYSVIRQDGPIEIRSYAPALMAEVNLTGNRRDALQQGFRVLAGYIFGGNQTGDKVAMTAPVTQVPSATAQTQGADGQWTVSFMMPSAYSAETLPAPNRDDIRFVQTAPSTQAVIRFSGWATPTRLTQFEADLRAYLDANGLTADGNAMHYYYDDPMRLPWKRRNEVALMLDDPLPENGS